MSGYDYDWPKYVALLSDRQMATILAALRHWQGNCVDECIRQTTAPFVDGETREPTIWDIADNGGVFACLDREEIDELCEDLSECDPVEITKID